MEPVQFIYLYINREYNRALVYSVIYILYTQRERERKKRKKKWKNKKFQTLRKSDEVATNGDWCFFSRKKEKGGEREREVKRAQ